MSARQVLDQSRAALHTARGAVHDLEYGIDATRQLASIRQIVIECRRSTFVLQKLSSRVPDWDNWWAPHQAAMRGDPLMRYFADLRTTIEKEGLPVVMAEIYDTSTDVTIADVACGEDEFGIWISGAARTTAMPGEVGENLDPASIALRNFRLPDPPQEHNGQPLADFRFAVLADLAITCLSDRVLGPTVARFGDAL
jgi:hypothetical protein